MRKEATFCTNSRDPFSLWISDFKLPAESWKRICSLPPRAGNKATTGGKMGIGKGLERWKSPLTSWSCFAAYHRIPEHLENGSDSLLCYKEHLSHAFSKLGRKQTDDSAIYFSHPNWQTKPTALTTKPGLSPASTCRIFPARKHRENSTPVLLSMFLDKYLIQLPLSLTLVLLNYRCKSKGPRGNGQLNGFLSK